MTARVQHAISTRFGLFHNWRNKNIIIKKRLVEKYRIFQFDKLAIGVANRNLSSKRTARAGFIKALSIAQFYNRRNNIDEEPIIKITSSYFDILLQDYH